MRVIARQNQPAIRKLDVLVKHPERAPLTDEQVKNWRSTLFLTLGPWAMMMPVEQIEAIRDRMHHQAEVFARDLRAEAQELEELDRLDVLATADAAELED
jgi:hypothetical protein